jgi:hypothetical protein
MGRRLGRMKFCILITLINFERNRDFEIFP